jgi:hypothetical protein
VTLLLESFELAEQAKCLTLRKLESSPVSSGGLDWSDCVAGSIPASWNNRRLFPWMNDRYNDRPIRLSERQTESLSL